MIVIVRTLFLLVLLVPTLAAVEARAAVRTLVAIGQNVGLADEQRLLWAEEDARRLRDVFVELGGVAPERASLVQGATKADVLVELARVRGQIEETRRRGERAELFVTYSGHGDADALHLGDERLSLDELSRALASIPADMTVLVLDACRTETGPRSGRTRGAAKGAAFDVKLVRELAPRGRVTLSSTSADELAQESDDIEGAFFTHHIVAGLRGAADGDRDGRVTLDEVYAYAHARTLAQSFAAPVVQHPERTATLSGEGELVVAQLDRAPARVQFASDVEGGLLLVDGRSARVIVEVKKARGAPLSLAVPPGRLRVLSRKGASSGIAELSLARGQTREVALADFTSTTQASATSRGPRIDMDVDVTPWIVSAAALVATPGPGPGAPAGGIVSVERRVFGSPLFVGTRHAFTFASGSDDVTRRRFEDTQYRGALTLGTDVVLGPLRLGGALGAGAHLAGQTVRSLDEDRLARIGLDATVQGSTAGPMALVALSASLVARDPLAVFVGVDGGASLLRIDADDVLSPWAMFVCGLAVEL